MDSILSVITLVVVAAHIGLLGYNITQRKYITPTQFTWLTILNIAALLASATYFLSDDFMILEKSGRGISLILLLIGSMVSYGMVLIQDMIAEANKTRTIQIWAGVCGSWTVSILISAIVGNTFLAGQPEWLVDLFQTPDLSTIFTFVGLFASGIVLIVVALRVFYTINAPESANRALFWIINTALLMLGILLTSTGTAIITLLGMLLLFLGVVGASYASQSHRIFSMRNGFFIALRIVAFVSIAWAMIFTSTYLIVTTGISTDAQGLLIIAGLAIIVAGLYIPIRQFVEYLIQQFSRYGRIDPTKATQEYSQIISEAVELEQLLVIATNTLNRVLGVHSSTIVLLNSAATARDTVELIALNADSTGKTNGVFHVESPVYTQLVIKREPITQFDLDHDPKYKVMSEDEKQFFHLLKMSAYAPIVLENVMIGILACGEKVDDTAFYPRDLELLTLLAQQTGIALRNARLVEDLQHLNKSMQSLNQTLKNTNEQLGRMDSVKSDFVTIASHELRTPLAQIRGYTDIMEALNEQGLLDQEQTQTMVGNLAKATERMEELISAMLDVSQLDVDAMDLHFTETSILSVISLAIEPMNEAINQRRISLFVKGLKGLPAIQADLQRLVQAFRNIIVNAVKFTPDGGKIEIIGEFQKVDTSPNSDFLLIRISDTGVGIDPNNLEMIFKKFFRAYDPSLHSTGTYKFLGAGPGLGLTIARGVIEGHGGQIWAESDAHDMKNFPGATFYISLPVSTPEGARRTLTFTGNDAAAQAINQGTAQPEIR